MKTKIFKNVAEDICEASKIIASGGLVAFPTETVYGLGANALDEEAVSRIYSAKGRPSDNPMIVHISAIGDVERIANLSKLNDVQMEKLRKVSDAFWPGPLTVILPKAENMPRVTTGGLDTVAVRMPSHKVARMIIQSSGCPIAAPSANLSGKPSPTTAAHTLADMDGRIDGLIWGDDCQVGIESTVVDMTCDVPVILRPGEITKADLERVLMDKVDIDPSLVKEREANSDIDPRSAVSMDDDNDSGGPRSPGMKYKHYAPDAEMTIYFGDIDKGEQEARLDAKALEERGKSVEILKFTDSKIAAHELFKFLREADEKGIDVILAIADLKDELGFSVMNRMFKSAGYNIKKV
ncbi:L-threonylcarbamoyladenylate synthase [Eubacteriales bacterium KG127]